MPLLLGTGTFLLCTNHPSQITSLRLFPESKRPQTSDIPSLPFATLSSSDNEYERISNLERPGVFRLNIGVGRQTFQSLFGTAKVDVSSDDFTVFDVIMPHPDHAPQNTMCVLSPSDATVEKIRALLAEAYDIAVRRYT